MADQKRKRGKVQEKKTEKINIKEIERKAEKTKSIRLKWYKKRQEINIGSIIFALVFVYLLVTVFLYATSKRISVYEVKEGSIVRDNFYNGLILREEQVVNAEASGYVSYFHGEGDKVRSGGNIYAISPTQISAENATEEEAASLSEETQKTLMLRLQSFSENYNAQNFSSVYALKNEISSTLQNASNQTKTVRLDAAAAAEGSNINIVPSVRDGIVGLTIDGYEGKTADQLDASDFDRNAYQAARLEDQTQVVAGKPVYKLITSEKWNVYIQLDKETAEALSKTNYIKTRIQKDNATIWADFSISEKDGLCLGCLSYENSMIRYVGDRFLSVELILEDESGLKIPKSAVVKREFYEIPTDYLVSGGNSSSLGVMVQGEDGDPVYQEAVSCFNSESEDIVYISPKGLSDGMILICPQSLQTYRISDKKELTGVYNINKGYAVFNQINILCENDDYYIVQDQMENGPSNYDHIVQDGNMVEEGEVVFQ